MKKKNTKGNSDMKKYLNENVEYARWDGTNEDEISKLIGNSNYNFYSHCAGIPYLVEVDEEKRQYVYPLGTVFVKDGEKVVALGNEESWEFCKNKKILRNIFENKDEDIVITWTGSNYLDFFDSFNRDVVFQKNGHINFIFLDESFSLVKGGHFGINNTQARYVAEQKEEQER